MYKTKKWKVLLGCWFTASLFWLYSKLNDTYTREIKYPINFVLTREKTQIKHPDVATKIDIEITCEGWWFLKSKFFSSKNALAISVPRRGNQPLLKRGELQSLITKHFQDVELKQITLNRINTKSLLMPTREQILDSKKLNQ